MVVRGVGVKTMEGDDKRELVTVDADDVGVETVIVVVPSVSL